MNDNIEVKHRVAVLIRQLTDLQQQDAPLQKILSTTQILLAELENTAMEKLPSIVYKKYITVIYPDIPSVARIAQPEIKDDSITEKEVIGAVPIPKAEITGPYMEQPEETVTIEQNINPAPEPIVVEEPLEESVPNEEATEIPDKEIIGATPPEEPDNIIVQQKEETVAEIPEAKDEFVSLKEEVPAPQFNLWETVPTAIPTLTAQEPEQKTPTTVLSINEQLARAAVTAPDLFEQTPIKDLKKAIDVNERFQFVNELFRGDEAMYERSIKTINSFRIRPEAEFWIQRELKVKLGWDDQSPTVKKFMNLVNRRFA